MDDLTEKQQEFDDLTQGWQGTPSPDALRRRCGTLTHLLSQMPEDEKGDRGLIVDEINAALAADD